MRIFDTPIPLGDTGRSVTAHDGASYVLDNGSTLWAPAPALDATAEAVAAAALPLLDNPPAPPVLASSADIKAEARRRILEIAPEWKQANLIARVLELTRDHGTAVSIWPAEAQAENAAAQAIWDKIKAVREHSNALELNPPTLAALRSASWPL